MNKIRLNLTTSLTGLVYWDALTNQFETVGDYDSLSRTVRSLTANLQELEQDFPNPTSVETLELEYIGLQEIRRFTYQALSKTYFFDSAATSLDSLESLVDYLLGALAKLDLFDISSTQQQMVSVLDLSALYDGISTNYTDIYNRQEAVDYKVSKQERDLSVIAQQLVEIENLGNKLFDYVKLQASAYAVSEQVQGLESTISGLYQSLDRYDSDICGRTGAIAVIEAAIQENYQLVGSLETLKIEVENDLTEVKGLATKMDEISVAAELRCQKLNEFVRCLQIYESQLIKAGSNVAIEKINKVFRVHGIAPPIPECPPITYIPPELDEIVPTTKSPKKTTNPPNTAPLSDCFIQLSSQLVGGRSVNGLVSLLGDLSSKFDDFVLVTKDYTDLTSFPAVSSQFNGLAIGPRMHCVIYSEPDYVGSVLFEKTGPCVVLNLTHRNTNFDIYKENYPDYLQAIFPQALRTWSASDMNGWLKGSMKLTCEPLPTTTTKKPCVPITGDACQVFFTDGVITGPTPSGTPGTHFFDLTYSDGKYSAITGSGKFTDLKNTVFKGKTLESGGTLDSIAIKPGVSLKIWKNPDFTGTVLLDAVGPLWICNSRIPSMCNEARALVFSEPWESMFPKNKRVSSSSVMDGWVNGSFEVGCCIDDNSTPTTTTTVAPATTTTKAPTTTTSTTKAPTTTTKALTTTTTTKVPTTTTTTKALTTTTTTKVPTTTTTTTARPIITKCGSSSTSGGLGVTIDTYDFSPWSGPVWINYYMGAIKDQIDVYIDDVYVAGTGGFVAYSGVIPFTYPGSGVIKVVVTGVTTGTSWNYTISCTEPTTTEAPTTTTTTNAPTTTTTKKPTDNRATYFTCGSIAVSDGTPAILDHYNFTPWSGTVYFDYDFGNVPTKLEIYYVGDTYDYVTGTDFVTGTGTLSAVYPGIGLLKVYVYSSGNIWKYSTRCWEKSPYCEEDPTAPVYETLVDDYYAGFTGTNKETAVKPIYEAFKGRYLLHVQPDIYLAAIQTLYLMRRTINIPVSGTYLIRLAIDNAYELYIDCQLVGSGEYGMYYVTTTISAGDHDFILKYLNTTSVSPGYAGFEIISSTTGSAVYSSRAPYWKGMIKEGTIVVTTTLAPTTTAVPVTTSKPIQRECGSTSTSGGAGVTVDLYDFSPLVKTVSISYDMYEVPDQLDVYINDVYVTGTGGFVLDKGTLVFNYPGSGIIKVIVSGADIGTFWTYTINCSDVTTTTTTTKAPTTSTTTTTTKAPTTTTSTTTKAPTTTTTTTKAPTTSTTTTSTTTKAPTTTSTTKAPTTTTKAPTTTTTTTKAPTTSTTTTSTTTKAPTTTTTTTKKPTTTTTTTTTKKPTTTTTTTTTKKPLVCNQSPTAAVNEMTIDAYIAAYYATSPVAASQGKLKPLADFFTGNYVLFVQSNILKAAANTNYLLKRNISIPAADSYTFKLVADDSFELYIDCVQVKTGGYGANTFTCNIAKGTREFILRYKNVPDLTPSYIGFKLLNSSGSVIYTTRATSWKGQANSIGEIEWV